MPEGDGIKRREPVNYTVRVVLAVASVPQQARRIEVPAGASVYVRGHNGAAGNVGAVKVGSGPDEVTGWNCRSIAPNTETPWPCANTGEIWCVGGAGDGIEIAIRG